MVNAYGVDLAVARQFEEQGMGRLKHLGVLHPDADEFVDGKKPPVIDNVQGHFPEGQPIGLLG